MGGIISVKSFVGQGTTFTFTIRAKVHESQPRGQRPAEIRGRRVLVVDDNSTNRRVLCGQLELWGMEPHATVGADEALKALERSGPFDLAILDYHMPGVDGMTLGHQIRHAGTTESLPMILLSSSLVLAKDDPERLFAARLLKPARQSSLFDSIMVALGVEGSGRPTRVSEPGFGVPSDAPPLNILVADDNEINRNVAGLVLRRFGYEVDFAVNGRDVVERVAHRAVASEDEGPYDLVFMDIQMPEMDGLEATRAIRRLEAERPAERWPRIVAMTANALQEDRELSLEAGMDDYLMKPLDFDAVARVLHDASQILGARAPATSVEEKSQPAQEVATSDSVLVDWSRLDELSEYDTPEGTIVKGAIASFLDQAPTRLAEIRGAIQRSDAPAVRQAAHALKGAASNIGATAAASCASKIESTAAKNSLDGLGQLVDELATTIDGTSVELHQRVG